MCEARQAMHGDPDAMRRFADHLTGVGEQELPTPPPAPMCEGGSQGCAAFTAADVVSTMALTDFLADTRDAIATLRAAAAVAAEDYASTDEAGAHAVTVATTDAVLSVSPVSPVSAGGAGS